MTPPRTAGLYHATRKRKRLIFGALLLLLFTAAVVAAGIGTVAIPPADVLAAFGHAVLPGLIDAPATQNAGFFITGYRLQGLMIVSFAASACLAFTGVIWFIDLIAPHICRMIVGNDYRYLLPCSALMDALILLVSDTTARSIFSPVEIPVGVIMYILGGLFFLYLITRGHGRDLG